MRYDAFISYRHAELDTFVAKKIHKQLETFKVPRGVKKTSGKKSIKRVFRDQEELPIGSDLNNNIESALQESEYLIVICSPRTPGSEWVRKEIETFISLHDRNHVLAVLVEGEPDESFPDLLLKDENGNSVEPLAADVRGESQREVASKIKTEVMRLAAPLLYCSYDDLRQRHRERRVRKITAIASCVAVLGVAFGIYSFYNATMIKKNYNAMLVNESKYLADVSGSLLEYGDRRSAALVAIEALPFHMDRPFVGAAQKALADSLNLYLNGEYFTVDGILKHEIVVEDICISLDGKYAVTEDVDGYVCLWNLETKEVLFKAEPRYKDDGEHANVRDIGIDEEHFYVCDEQGVRAYGYDGALTWQYDFDTEAHYGGIDNSYSVIVIGNSNKVIFLSAKDGSIIGEIKNESDEGFYGTFAFDSEAKNFAIARFFGEDKDNKSKLTCYSFEDNKIKNYTVKGSYVSGICFDDSGNMYTSSMKGTYDFSNIYINKLSDGKSKWCNEPEAFKMKLDTNFILKYSPYDDMLVFSNGYDIYLYETDSGKLANVMGNESKLKDIKLSIGSDVMAVLYQNGSLAYVSKSTDKLEAVSLYEDNMLVSSMAMSNGTILIQRYNSSDVLVLKYLQDPTCVEIEQFDSAIVRITSSEDNETYCVNVGFEDSLYFYSADGKLLMKDEGTDDSAFTEQFFINNNTYVTLGTDGLIYYDISSNKKEDASSIFESDYSAKMAYDVKLDRAIMYNASSYTYFEISNQKVVYKGELKDYYDAIILGNDDKHAYGFKDTVLYEIDLTNGTGTKFGVDNIAVSSKWGHGKKTQLSDDGTRLLLACKDGVFRILNLQTKEVEFECEFYGNQYCFIRLSADGSKVFLQGDDYRLKIIDIDTGICEFVYDKASDEFNSLKYTSDNRIVIANDADMLIFNEDYECLADIPNGFMYYEPENKVFSKTYRGLYQFDLRTLDELLVEAQKQFGDCELSDNEKIKYNIN